MTKPTSFPWKKRLCAVFAGSFDPLTLGHENIIERAAETFENVYVFVANNSAKSPAMFSAAERLSQIKQMAFANDLLNVHSYIMAEEATLLVTQCRNLGVRTLVRGIRNESDFAYETALAAVNRSQDPEIETVYFMTHPSFTHVSSSAVKELARLNGNICGYVNPRVKAALEKKLGKKLPPFDSNDDGLLIT